MLTLDVASVRNNPALLPELTKSYEVGLEKNTIRFIIDIDINPGAIFANLFKISILACFELSLLFFFERMKSLRKSKELS